MPEATTADKLRALFRSKSIEPDNAFNNKVLIGSALTLLALTPFRKSFRHMGRASRDNIILKILSKTKKIRPLVRAAGKENPSRAAKTLVGLEESYLNKYAPRMVSDYIEGARTGINSPLHPLIRIVEHGGIPEKGKWIMPSFGDIKRRHPHFRAFKLGGDTALQQWLKEINVDEGTRTWVLRNYATMKGSGLSDAQALKRTMNDPYFKDMSKSMVRDKGWVMDAYGTAAIPAGVLDRAAQLSLLGGIATRKNKKNKSIASVTKDSLKELTA